MRLPTAIERRLLRLPPSVRRRILRHSYAAGYTARKERGGMQVDISEIELASCKADGSVRCWLARPKRCGVCGEEHALFVSRGGSTRCCACDEGFLAAEAAMRAEKSSTP